MAGPRTRAKAAEQPLLSVVMPVYNEAATVEIIIHRVFAAELPVRVELVVVDDGSKDGSREVLSRLAEVYGEDRFRLFFQERNQGKGAAVWRGFQESRGDYVIIQDADLEYDPRDIDLILVPLLDGRADAVFGSRFLGGPHRVLFFWHYMGNRFLTFLTNLLYNINLTDMETCYKALRGDVARSLQLESRRFGVEPEITAKICRRRLSLFEVPISYSGRSYDEGKKITWRDGAYALWELLRWRLSSRAVP